MLEATAKVLDNFDINLKHRFTTKLIWILFNEDTEKVVAGIILALFKSLQQKENTIRPLCMTALEKREEIITKNVKQITDVLEATSLTTKVTLRNY